MALCHIHVEVNSCPNCIILNKRAPLYGPSGILRLSRHDTCGHLHPLKYWQISRSACRIYGLRAARDQTYLSKICVATFSFFNILLHCYFSHSAPSTNPSSNSRSSLGSLSSSSSSDDSCEPKSQFVKSMYKLLFLGGISLIAFR